MNAPRDLRYTTTHEWVRTEDGVVTVGLSDYAQNELGDITFLELPEVGDEVTKGEPLGVVESVKAATDIYAPVSGEVVAHNDVAIDSPELVNNSPYGNGWLIKIRMSEPEQLDELMNATTYDEFAESATH